MRDPQIETLPYIIRGEGWSFGGCFGVRTGQGCIRSLFAEMPRNVTNPLTRILRQYPVGRRVNIGFTRGHRDNEKEIGNYYYCWGYRVHIPYTEKP